MYRRLPGLASGCSRVLRLVGLVQLHAHDSMSAAPVVKGAECPVIVSASAAGVTKASCPVIVSASAVHPTKASDPNIDSIFYICGAPGRTRTCSQLLRRPRALSAVPQIREG